jgi:hypothetical protein
MPKTKKKSRRKRSGRPTTYTLELGDLICAELSQGKSLRSICRKQTRPSLSTVLLWVVKGDRKEETYTQFSEQYARAREAQSESLLDEVIEIADEVSGDYRLNVKTKNGKINTVFDKENVLRSKLRIETRFKAAAKQHPRKFGERIKQILSDPNDKPVAFTLNIGDAGKDED